MNTHFFNPNISYFARVDCRLDTTPFGMYQSDRLMGLYILGKTGSGKTNLLESLMFQDMEHNRGFCVLDVNGDLVQNIYNNIPDHRKQDVVFLNASDSNLSWGYNPLKKVAPVYRSLVVSHLLASFQHIWGNAWGVRLEYILRNVLLTLLEQPKATFDDIAPLLLANSFRQQCLKYIADKNIRRFWEQEFPKYGKGDILPVLNKVGSFLSIPNIKKILVDNQDQISLTDIMNNEKILLVNLSKGTLGADSAHLLGSLLLHSLSASGFYRVTIPVHKRKPFFIYLDEFHNFTTLSLVNMFSELRKFKIGFVLAHQYLNQLQGDIKHAVLGNIGSMVTFRLGLTDAKVMAQEFYPVFTTEDFTSLAHYHIYVRLLINGKISKPFSAKTIPSDCFIYNSRYL
jgi:hypothetical protein